MTGCWHCLSLQKEQAKLNLSLAGERAGGQALRGRTGLQVEQDLPWFWAGLQCVFPNSPGSPPTWKVALVLGAGGWLGPTV